MNNLHFKAKHTHAVLHTISFAATLILCRTWDPL